VVVKDIDSGLKEDRKGLKKLIELAGRIYAVVIACKDRLTVFRI